MAKMSEDHDHQLTQQLACVWQASCAYRSARDAARLAGAKQDRLAAVVAAVTQSVACGRISQLGLRASAASSRRR